MTMRTLLSIITLRYFNISGVRKRALRRSALLLLTLIIFQAFKALVIPPIPYLSHILAVIILSLFANIIFNVVRLFVVSSHRKRRGINNEERDNFTVGTGALVNTATVFAAVAATFLVFDIAFRSFLSSIALVAVALTIIFQDFIKNFLFGLAMMFSSDYEIGDYIQVGDMPKGVIVTITFSSVQIKTEAGDLLFVPNTVIRAHQVVNFSKLKPKRINTEFSVLRTQLGSVDAFEQTLALYLQKTFPETFELDKLELQVKETNKDEVLFSLEIPSRKASLKLKEQTNRAVQKFAVEYNH